MFDVAREPLAAEPAGWVYRSDAPAAAPLTPAAAAPVTAPSTPAAPRSFADRLVAPAALALTIALAPLRCFAGLRSRR